MYGQRHITDNASTSYARAIPRAESRTYEANLEIIPIYEGKPRGLRIYEKGEYKTIQIYYLRDLCFDLGEIRFRIFQQETHTNPLGKVYDEKAVERDQKRQMEFRDFHNQLTGLDAKRPIRLTVRVKPQKEDDWPEADCDDVIGSVFRDFRNFKDRRDSEMKFQFTGIRVDFDNRHEEANRSMEVSIYAHRENSPNNPAGLKVRDKRASVTLRIEQAEEGEIKPPLEDLPSHRH